MRQSTLTLPQRFSRTAWAIRLCSRFTSASAFCQSILSQLAWRWRTCLNAPAEAQRSTAVCCFSKFSFAFESLTLRNHKGSRHPLGSGHQTLSTPLQSGLRFFPDELPGAGSVRLAVTPSVPDLRKSRQPVYHVSCAQPCGPFRSPPSAGGSCVRDWSALSPSAWPRTVLVPACQSCWLVVRNGGARVQLRLTMRPES